jgi:hypothetical protein
MAGQLIVIEGGASAELARVSGTPTSSAIPVQALANAHLSGAAVSLATVTAAGDGVPRSPYLQGG